MQERFFHYSCHVFWGQAWVRKEKILQTHLKPEQTSPLFYPQASTGLPVILSWTSRMTRTLDLLSWTRVRMIKGKTMVVRRGSDKFSFCWTTEVPQGRLWMNDKKAVNGAKSPLNTGWWAMVCRPWLAPNRLHCSSGWAEEVLAVPTSDPFLSITFPRPAP